MARGLLGAGLSAGEGPWPSKGGCVRSIRGGGGEFDVLIRSGERFDPDMIKGRGWVGVGVAWPGGPAHWKEEVVGLKGL